MRSFKKTIIASISFLLCVVLMFEIIIWPYFHGQYYFYTDAQVRDDLEGTVDLLISGASHACCAFDTAVLDEALHVNSYNLAGNLMSMPAKKKLLQKELDRNPVKTVFIELSYNSLTRDRKEEGAEGDIYALARMGNLRERVEFFFDSFYMEEYCTVLADAIERGVDAWSKLRNGAPPALDSSLKGFRAMESQDCTMTAEEFSELHNTAAITTNTSWDNKQPLLDMVEACQARGIEVVFITTPISDEMLAQYENLEEAHQWYLYYANEYGCTFLDFNLYRQRDALLPDDTAFFDKMHLSKAGAAAFSRTLSELYLKIKAGEDVSDLFYDSYAQMDEAMVCAYAKP